MEIKKRWTRAGSGGDDSGDVDYLRERLISLLHFYCTTGGIELEPARAFI